MLYILCIGVFALQITADPRVKGFLLPSVKDTCFKVRNYADDTTTFLRDLPSLAALFDVVFLHERDSGAKLNRSTIEAMWVGALNGTRMSPLDLRGLRR